MTIERRPSCTGQAVHAPGHQVWLLAVSYGVTIANLYYCQPLLPDMARSYPSALEVGYLPAVGQLGYALGLVLVVPLGDIVRRRPLVCLLLLVEVVALVVTSTAPTVAVLLAAGGGDRLGRRECGEHPHPLRRRPRRASTSVAASSRRCSAVA
ncbi:hypothetical protein ACFSTC_54675 [Nonomuraea ferruginea]